MPKKIIKTQRKLFDALGLRSGKRLFYHLGRPNFGDDINEWFFSELSREKYIWSGCTHEHILGIGSIAGRANANSVVVGSGFIKEEKVAPPVKKIVSLRGQLSAQIFGISPEFLGDPVVLINRILPISRGIKYRVGVIPHHYNVELFRRILREANFDYILIDPRASHFEVIEKINECSFIASQSLHGLVVADSYSIPNAWIEPSPDMIGGEFKFRDYYSSTDGPKEPVALSSLLENLSSTMFTVNNYKGGRRLYLEYLKFSLTEGLLV